MPQIHIHFHDARRRVLDFDESKVNRGQKGGGHGGQFQKKGEGGGGASPQAQGKPQTGGQTPLHGDLKQRVEPSGYKQNVHDLDQMYELAKQDEPKFLADVQAVARSVGGEAMFTPPKYALEGTTLKSRESAERKLNDEYGGDVSQLTDILRGTVATNTVEDARQAAVTFINQNKQNIVSIKDRIVNPLAGYRDIMVKFKTPQGLIAELQFNGKNMIKTKLGPGHQIYEEVRKLEAQDRSVPSSQLKQIINTLNQRSMRLYNTAYRKDGNGNWGMTQDAAGDDVSVPNYWKLSRDGTEFYAKIVYEDGGMRIYSTRHGDWAPDPLSVADLLFPMYELNDWDIEPLDALPGDVGGDEPQDGEDLPPEDTSDRGPFPFPGR